MTYFSFRSARGTRGEDVYEGSTLLGRVKVLRDWRSRLTLRQSGGDVFCATPLTGEAVPGLFPSRHDAAEALFALTSGAPGEDEVHLDRPASTRRTA